MEFSVPFGTWHLLEKQVQRGKVLKSVQILDCVETLLFQWGKVSGILQGVSE